MLKGVLFFILVCLFQSVNSLEFTDKTGKVIQIVSCTAEDLPACEEIFIQAFMEAYEVFTPEQLAVKDKLQFLKEAFANVYDDLQMGEQTLLVAKHQGIVVGFAGFKKTEEPFQIYITQLAVEIDHWHRGIGKHLVFCAFDLFPETKNLVVIPRKINLIARNFYFKLGFVESAYMHPGYNPEKYIGYEFELTQEMDEVD